MAKQMGTFVDDERLRPRDNSGGPKGPHGIMGSDFGDGGKPVGAEPASRNDGRDGAAAILKSGGNPRQRSAGMSIPAGKGY